MGAKAAGRAGKCFLIGACALWLLCGDAMALIMIHRGNDSLPPSFAQRFPLGFEAVANLPSRLGYLMGPGFGDGLYTFDYRCESAEEFNEGLKLFAMIHRPRLELIVRDGPKTSTMYSTKPNETVRVDWSLIIWNPEGWHRMHSNPAVAALSRESFMKPVPVPRIVVYVGDGAIDWHEVAIPDNLEVIDQRVEAAPVQPIQGGVIRGSVFDMATGRPIADARVGIWALDPDTESHYETEAVAVADKLGAYLIQSVLTPGSYEIRFAAFGYATRSESYILGDETQYNEYEVELMRTSHIGGIVVDAEGNPVPGVRVEAREVLAIDGHSYYRKTGRFTQKPGAQTDDQGRFTIEDIPAGYARLRARAPDLFSYGSLVLHEVPSDDVRIVVVGTGIIRGRVVGGAEAARIGQLHIHLIALDPDNKWGGAARCKEDGDFEFKGVPPGRYRLSTVPEHLPGVAQNPNARIVEVKPGATVEVAVLHHLATPTPTPVPPIS